MPLVIISLLEKHMKGDLNLVEHEAARRGIRALLFEQFNLPGSMLFSQCTAINAFGSLCIYDILF